MALPGRFHRKGISLVELLELYPDEKSVVNWFESVRWSEGRYCPHCGSLEIYAVRSIKPMPYWYRDCRSYFSVRTGTVVRKFEGADEEMVVCHLPVRDQSQGVSSMKLHRDINVTQKTAWFMLNRVRKSWNEDGFRELLSGIVEVHETHMGGKRRNMSNRKRRELKDTGRGAVGKKAVVGARERRSRKIKARVTERTDKTPLHGMIMENVSSDALVYTDEHKHYIGMPNRHEAVRHGVSEYVRDQAHTNDIESFWAMLKRGCHGVYHHKSCKHLQRYANEFSGRAGVRGS